MDYIETLKQKFADLKAALCIPGGSIQKHDLLYTAFDKKILTPREMLLMISNLYEDKERTLNEGGLLPVKSFSFGKEHHVYPVLDKSGKFCMKHYGEDEWNDVAYVFWVMDVDKAWEIYETFDKDDVDDNLDDSSDTEDNWKLEKSSDSKVEYDWKDVWTQDDFYTASGEERFKHYAKICEVNNFVPINWKLPEQMKPVHEDAWNEIEGKFNKKERILVYIEFDGDDWIPYVYTEDGTNHNEMYTSLEDLLDDSSAFFMGGCRIK